MGAVTGLVRGLRVEQARLGKCTPDKQAAAEFPAFCRAKVAFKNEKCSEPLYTAGCSSKEK
jgi:hypothetical protein